MGSRPRAPQLTNALRLVAIAIAAATIATALHAAPVKIRMGVGTSSEEQAWLMKARADLTPGQGKAYIYDMSVFRSAGERLIAFQAGQLDALTSSTTGILFAVSKGVPLVVPISMARESLQAFSNAYLARANSDVSLTNLKGKTIGINGYRTSIELYARMALARSGLDPGRDVKWLVVPLPQMEDALRQGKIDLGAFPSIFAFVALKNGGLRKVFDSVGISGIEEEFDIAFRPEFVAKNRPAVQAWIDDFISVTRFFSERPLEGRQNLLHSNIVQVDPASYLAMTAKDDLLRTVEATRPDVAMFGRLQDELIKAKFMEGRVDIGKLVDTSLLRN